MDTRDGIGRIRIVGESPGTGSSPVQAMIGRSTVHHFLKDYFRIEVSWRHVVPGTVPEDFPHHGPDLPCPVADELPLQRLLHPSGTNRAAAYRAQDEKLFLQVPAGDSGIWRVSDDMDLKVCGGIFIAAVLAPASGSTSEFP
jgi:hypothetical protein